VLIAFDLHDYGVCFLRILVRGLVQFSELRGRQVRGEDDLCEGLVEDRVELRGGGLGKENFGVCRFESLVSENWNVLRA
jgi:hypothetical protein